MVFVGSGKSYLNMAGIVGSGIGLEDYRDGAGKMLAIVIIDW